MKKEFYDDIINKYNIYLNTNIENKNKELNDFKE